MDKHSENFEKMKAQLHEQGYHEKDVTITSGKHSKSPGPIAIQWVQGFYPSNLLLIYYFCRKWKPIRCFGYCNASGG